MSDTFTEDEWESPDWHKKSKLQARLKDLALKQINFRSPTTRQDLQSLLEISQTETENLQAKLAFQRKKNYQLEFSLKSVTSRAKDLQVTNHSLTNLLLQKDALVSKYLSQLLHLKQQVEFWQSPVKFPRMPSQKQQIDDHIQQQGKTANINIPVGKFQYTHYQISPSDPFYYQSGVINLRRRIAQLQELLKISEESNKNLNYNLAQREQERKQLKQKLNQTRLDFSALSSQYKQQATDTGYNTLIHQIQSRRQQDISFEKKKIKYKYKELIDLLRGELQLMKQRISSLLDSKSSLQEQIKQLKATNKSIRNRKQKKNQQEIIISLQNQIRYLKSQPSQDMQVDQLNKLVHNLHQTTETLKITIFSHQKTISALKKRNQELEKTLLNQPGSPQMNPKQLMQQLSYLILSKEDQNLQAKQIFERTFGSQCTALISSYEEKVNELSVQLESYRNQHSFVVNDKLRATIESLREEKLRALAEKAQIKLELAQAVKELVYFKQKSYQLNFSDALAFLQMEAAVLEESLI